MPVKEQITYNAFGTDGNIGQNINDDFCICNDMAYSTIGVHIIPPTGGTCVFEGTFDGINWDTVNFRSLNTDTFANTVTSAGDYIGSISALRLVRIRTSVGGSAPGTVIGRLSRDASVIEGIEFGFPPHRIGFPIFHADVSYTSAQTGATIYTPPSGKRFVVTDLIIVAGGNTDGILTIFDETDTTGNRLFKGDIDISNNYQYSMNHPYRVPYTSTAADNVLKVSTSTDISVDITINGYLI